MRATPYTPYYKLRYHLNEIRMTQGELALRLKRSIPYVTPRLNRSGKTFNLRECYEILHLIGAKDYELCDYFPKNGGTKQ